VLICGPMTGLPREHHLPRQPKRLTYISHRAFIADMIVCVTSMLRR